MLELNPLAAALHGIGYGSLLTALQGLWAVTVVPAPMAIEALGSHAALTPRRRVRRTWLSPHQMIVPAKPAKAIALEDDDEEALSLACLL